MPAGARRSNRRNKASQRGNAIPPYWRAAGRVKRMLGAGLRPPTDGHERLLLETALTGADPHRRGIRGNTRSPRAPDVLGGIRENTRSPLAEDGLGGQNSRLTAPAVYLTPLKLNVCEVRHGCGKRPPKPDAALVVRSSRARSIQFDANIGLRHNGRPPVDRCGLLACPRGERGERENQRGKALDHRDPPSRRLTDRA